MASSLENMAIEQDQFLATAANNFCNGIVMVVENCSWHPLGFFRHHLRLPPALFSLENLCQIRQTDSMIYVACSKILLGGLNNSHAEKQNITKHALHKNTWLAGWPNCKLPVFQMFENSNSDVFSCFYVGIVCQTKPVTCLLPHLCPVHWQRSPTVRPPFDAIFLCMEQHGRKICAILDLKDWCFTHIVRAYIAIFPSGDAATKYMGPNQKIGNAKPMETHLAKFQQVVSTNMAIARSILDGFEPTANFAWKIVCAGHNTNKIHWKPQAFAQRLLHRGGMRQGARRAREGYKKWFWWETFGLGLAHAPRFSAKWSQRSANSMQDSW